MQSSITGASGCMRTSSGVGRLRCARMAIMQPFPARRNDATDLHRCASGAGPSARSQHAARRGAEVLRCTAGATAAAEAVERQEQQQAGAIPSPLASPSTVAGEVQGVDALIVGGGPAGLAVALLLHKRGWKRIVVLEQQPSVTKADLTKSYVYAIDGRGRKALDLFDLTETAKEAGASFGDLMTLPPDGTPKSTTLMIRDSNRQSYWMPRATFLEILYGAVQKAGSAIQVLTNASCISVTRSGPSGRIWVEAQAGGQRMTYEPRLLVGADGVSSVVREQLQKWFPGDNRFTMQKFPSPAAGLRIKVLLMPPNPEAKPSEGKSVVMSNPMVVSVVGNNGLRLGMLPIKSRTSPRTANIILKPEHPFWNINTPDALLSHLEASFPQLPIRDLVSKEQASAFISSSGTSFPRPQYCPTMQLLHGPHHTTATTATTTTTASGSSGGGSAAGSKDGNGVAGVDGAGVQGVLLVGDAVHCFPPDLGQGVNSALEDIAVLDKALEECGDKLEAALPLYEQRRLPDIKALIRLMQFGYPYQYNQDPVGKALWTANFMLRLGLNKLLPWLFAPPAFMMMQDPSLSYGQVVSRADATTHTLFGILGVTVVLAVLLLGGRPAV